MGRVILLENDHLPRGTTALAQLRLERKSAAVTEIVSSLEVTPH